MTNLLLITKGTDEGGHASAPVETKGSSTGGESSRIESHMDVVFGVSSSEEEKVEAKNVEGGGSSGPEKEAEEPSLALEADIGGPAHSFSEEMSGEIDFFVRHIAGGQVERGKCLGAKRAS